MKRVIAVLLATSLIITGMWYYSQKVAENSIIEVELYKCEESDISTSVYFNGRIENKEETNIYLSENAEVVENYVETGDKVCKGDLLFIAKPSENIDGIINGNELIEAVSNIGSYTTENSVTIKSDGSNIIVRSPVNGIITSFKAKKGNTLGIIMPCVVIAAEDDLQVCAEVQEDYIQDIEQGMVCSITGGAYKDMAYHGYIERIMPYATTGSLLSGSKDTKIDVLINISDADAHLKPGYSARVQVETGEIPNALTVPYNTIMQDENGNEYVMLYNRGNVEVAYIKTGIELLDTVEVVSGLKNGDLIIKEPDKITPGCRVRVKTNENF